MFRGGLKVNLRLLPGKNEGCAHDCYIGCRTCRRRKVKCDERQPLCDRCGKGGLTCEGFDRGVSFVDENEHAKRRSQKQAAIRAKNCDGDHPSNGARIPDYHSGVPQSSDYHERAFSDSGQSSDSLAVWQPAALVTPATSTAPLFPELNLSAFKNEIQISFTLANLFSGSEAVVKWLILGYNSGDRCINTGALKALSSTFYGRLNHDYLSEDEGRGHYIGVLKRLGHALGNNEGRSLDVLVSAMTAGCYEMIASSTFATSLLHTGGVAKLIEARGPRRHCQRFELSILENMRVSIILKGIIDRKHIFLELKEWKTIPWTLYPEGRTMTTWVEDILCDIPGILEDFDSVFAPEIPPREYKLRCEKLKVDIELHLRLLFEWRAVWETKYPNCCYEQVPQATECPFPTVLHFYDLDVCNGLMLYDSMVLLLVEVGIQLADTGFDQTRIAQETTFVHTNLLLNPPGASLYDTAMEICRSVDYHLSPPHENAGAYFIIFPLRKARDELPIGSVEHEWVKLVRDVIAKKSGFMFLLSVL